MKHKLRVAPRAWKELEAGVAWYEKQRAGLGAEFAYAIDEALSDLMTAPERWPLWQADAPYRRRVIHRFPYVLFYAVEGNIVRVVAIAHAKRQPGYWLR
jgi:toxin ParE1/3/4